MSEIELSLEAPAIHRRGYPLLVAVTVRNALPQRTYFALPAIDRFDVPPPLEFVVTRPGADEGEVLPSRPDGTGEDEAKGMPLGSGEARRMLFDLSELHPELVAGRHRLDGRYLGPVSASAAPVSFEVEVPGPDEAAAVARLRASNRTHEPSWNAFLTDNFREVEADELVDIPPAGRELLRLTLALHRAIHGPLGVAQLDPAMFRGLADGPVEGELAALEHEMLMARSDPAAGVLASSVLAKWPALAWRIAANADGKGPLQTWRMVYGAERRFPGVPDPLPYGAKRP